MTAQARPAAAPGALLLEARGLDLSLGDQGEMRGLSLAVAPGERVQLLGPMEAGAAVLRALAGLSDRAAGQVRLLGEDPWGGTGRRASARLARVGWLPREGALLANLTLAENLRLPLEYHRGAADLASLAAALACFGLAGAPELRPERVPLPLRRRVALARAVSLDPELLLLDDPLDDLDDVEAEALARALLAWAAGPGRGLVVASPDPTLARRLDARLVPLQVVRP